MDACVKRRNVTPCSDKEITMTAASGGQRIAASGNSLFTQRALWRIQTKVTTASGIWSATTETRMRSRSGLVGTAGARKTRLNALLPSLLLHTTEGKVQEA